MEPLRRHVGEDVESRAARCGPLLAPHLRRGNARLVDRWRARDASKPQRGPSMVVIDKQGSLWTRRVQHSSAAVASVGQTLTTVVSARLFRPRHAHSLSVPVKIHWYLWKPSRGDHKLDVASRPCVKKCHVTSWHANPCHKPSQTHKEPHGTPNQRKSAQTVDCHKMQGSATNCLMSHCTFSTKSSKRVDRALRVATSRKSTLDQE